MKKIIVISLLFSIITSEGLKAQGMQGIDTAGYKFWKNEMGTNIAPMLATALGADYSDSQFTLSFKRIVKGSNAMRINASIELYAVNANYYSYPITHDNYDLISQSATTEVRRYTQSKRDPKFQLGIGYEWRKGTHRLSRFYGADIIMGRMNTTYSKKDYFMVLDTNSYPNINGPIWVIDPQRSQPSTALDSRTNSFFLGLSPFYGFRYPITKRMILTAQMGCDLTALFGNYETNDYANGIHLSGMVTTFNFDTRGVISDVSLMYRF